MKRCLNDKKMAFLRGDTEDVKNKRKELRAKIQRAKMDFKHKVDDQFCTGNPRQAWKGLNTMMGRRSKGGDDDDLLDTPSFVNDLNRFYGRFDIEDFKDKSNTICLSAHRNPTIQLSEQEVGICLSQIKPHKAPGPDGLGGRALKVCASQLKPAVGLFQFLLNTCTVPKTWKHSIIRPVPKKPRSKSLNVVSKHLTSCIKEQFDPLQFAYRTNRGTDDATLTMVTWFLVIYSRITCMHGFYL